MGTDAVYDPFDGANTEDPYPVYRRLLREAPVFYNPARDFWALSRHEDVWNALMDWETYSSAEGVRIDDLLELAGPSPLTMDPPRHALLRNIIRKPFAPRSLADLTPFVTKTIDELLSDVEGAEEFDAVTQFAKVLPVAVICHMLGVPPQDVPRLKAWGTAMLETVPGQVGTPPAARQAALQLRDYWIDSLDQRRTAPQDDILSLLASAEVEGQAVPLDEQVGMCNLVLEAGNATTGTLIANALLAMEEHPDQQAWLRAHPENMPQAIEEFLRWEPPVQALLRVTKDAVSFGSITIAPGSRVLLLLGAANRDPRVWDDPDRLDVTRPVQRNLGFGEGIHHCLGAPLARLEAPLALRAFLTRYPRYRVRRIERFHDVSMRTLAHLDIAVAS